MAPLQTKLTFTQRLVLSSVLVAFGGALLNWPQQSSPDSQPASSRVAASPVAASPVSASPAKAGLSQSRVSAGWPRTFYESVKRPAGTQVDVSLQAGLLNLAVLVSLALLIPLVSELLTRRSQVSAGSRPLMLRVAGGCAALAAVGIGAWWLIDWPARAEIRQRAELWRRFGTVDLASPSGSAVRFLPAVFSELISDPQAVRLTAPSRQAIDQLAETTALRSITLIDANISAADLQRLAALRSLDHLQLVGCSLTEAHCLAIGSLPALLRLEVFGCPGVQHLLDPAIELGELTHFRAAGLPWAERTELTAEWAPRLQSLTLGFSAAQGEADLQIADLAELKQLIIDQRSEATADAALTIGLARLPKLTALELPNHIATTFDGDSLMRLQSISASHRFGDQDNFSPRPLKFRSLRLHSAPSLRSLRCDGDLLREIALSETPSLDRLVLSPAAGAVKPSGGSRRAQRRATTARISQLISQLATCDGPATLDLSGMPLFGVDLSPLAVKKRVQTLSLARTGANASQIRSFSGLTELKSLNLWHCDIRDGDLETILPAFPRLQSLRVRTSQLTRLEVIDHVHLQELFDDSPHHLKTLRLSGCPKLSGYLSLDHSLQQVEIRDAASLQGLAIKGPLPQHAVLDGFRDLEILKLEGGGVTDAVLEAFADCSKLVELSLINSALTSEGARKIARFEELHKLILPGAAVEDSTTSHWLNGSLTQLSEVDLSRTQIGGETLRALTRLQNLQRLNIGHTALRSSDLSPLRKMSQLYELEIAGLEITAEMLQACLAGSRIDRLDLSDCRLSSELKQWHFVSALRLMFLGLERCDLTDEEISRLLQRSSRLALALDGNPISEEIIRTLTESGRIIPTQDRRRYQQRLDSMVGGDDFPSNVSIDRSASLR